MTDITQILNFIKNKKLILLSILSAAVLTVFIIISIIKINHSLDIINPEILNTDTGKEINLYFKKHGYRLIDYKKNWQDGVFKTFYKKIKLSVNQKNTFNPDENSVYFSEYYLAVDLTNDYDILNNDEEIKIFNKIIKNEIKAISLIKANELNIQKRILIKALDAKPVNIYNFYNFEIYNNKTNKRLAKLENKLKRKDLKTIKPIILGFAGDFAIEDFVQWSIWENGVEFSLKEVNSLLETPDIMSVNLECSVSNNNGSKENKKFTYRANEEQFRVVSDSSIDYVCNANNHAMDFGDKALLDTIAIVEKNNIYHSGSGANKELAFKPAIIKVNDMTFSYFSLCEVGDEAGGYSTMKNFKAGDNKAGVAYYDKAYLEKLFKIEKEKNNLIIVQYHSGTEYDFSPSYLIKKHSKELIDMGADLVICHHPHVINGIEFYNNKMIAYSLGNFLFDIQKDHADEGLIIYVYVFNNKILTWSFYPVASQEGAVILDKYRMTDVKNRFKNLTDELN